MTTILFLFITIPKQILEPTQSHPIGTWSKAAEEFVWQIAAGLHQHSHFWFRFLRGS
jgi:hypothetical protein